MDILLSELNLHWSKRICGVGCNLQTLQYGIVIGESPK